jgi:hypothetical protein
MVWKNTSKVGFGVKGNIVIAWYCDSKLAGGPEDYKANVGTLCNPFDLGYNKCYAKLALAAHKAKRAAHEAGDSTFQLDVAGSKDL